ncbi:MAG: GGDEF domain-containing protein [Gammaproteobacteria bacterium]|nr:GGDEF domain-containing protein [Gammaproteobacteria bacterium]
MMAILSLLTQVAAIVLYQRLGAHTSFLYTYGLLALLSLHVVVSARFVDDMRALNLLGTILLIVTGVAIMTIAHRSGTINAGLMASIVLLFMVMPLVPWGLREACTIVVLTYLMFTLSSLSVGGRFETETLWTLQFLILASATTAMLIIVRNAMVRKDDIRARYDLEDAHRELQLISTRDPLTGAWNRRYLDQNFYAIARTARREGKTLQLALLDVDSFKYLNDTFGHHHGDEILRRLANIFMEHLPGNAHLLRLGGDEFAVLHSGPNFQELIGRCLKHLETDPRLLDVENGQPVLVSVGFAGLADDEWKDLEALYKRADANLYAMKERRKSA